MGVLLLLPLTREIVFQIPHYHVDGIGAMQFLNLILDTFRDPPKHVFFGEEHQNLSGSLGKTFSFGPPRIDDSRRAHKLAKDFQRGLPSINIGAKEATKTEHAIQMERSNFSVEETTATIAKTNQSGFTVTPVYHSAMIEAIQSCIDSKTRKYTNLFFINLREQLATQNDHLMPPVSLRLTVLPGSLPASKEQSFWKLT
jgi:hypothetical protein